MFKNQLDAHSNAMLWISVAAGIALTPGLAFLSNVVNTQSAVTAIWAVVLCIGVVGVIWAMYYAEKAVSALYWSANAAHVKAIESDPWAQQRKLMHISNQHVPDRPMLANGTVLYGALMMEELGETLAGLSAAMARAYNDPAVRHQICSREGLRALDDAVIIVEGMAAQLQTGALATRELLALVPTFSQSLAPKHAVELLDGTTDNAVVNCGFALSAGLPGPVGYREVVDSNLSKANPGTGMIDKTPDGKWIKGDQYHMPDLRRVLYEFTGDNAYLPEAPPHP